MRRTNLRFRACQEALFAGCERNGNCTLSAIVSGRIMPLSTKLTVCFMDYLPRARRNYSAVLSVRPKVAELSFQLFGRALHPELFEVHKTRTVERGEFSARLDITSAGHVITWRYRGLTLTEVAASAQHPLPERRRLLSYRLKGQRFSA